MSKQNKPKRPVCNLEFKQDAAQLVIEKGYNLPTSCRQLRHILKRDWAMG